MFVVRLVERFVMKIWVKRPRLVKTHWLETRRRHRHFRWREVHVAVLLKFNYSEQKKVTERISNAIWLASHSRNFQHVFKSFHKFSAILKTILVMTMFLITNLKCFRFGFVLNSWRKLVFKIQIFPNYEALKRRKLLKQEKLRRKMQKSSQALFPEVF